MGWGALVRAHVAEFGGYAALADELVHRLSAVPDAPRDRQTVEKGLRRLAGRGSKAGGQYGRWVLRHLGVPTDLRRWLAWLGQYHSRFADLPTGLRLEQLRLWDRPPISESAELAWVHVGLASAWLRLRDRERCEAQLERAEALAMRAGLAAELEVALLRARLLADADEGYGPAFAALDTADSRLSGGALEAEDRACYRARIEGQRIYLRLRPREPGAEPELDAARASAAAIPEGTGLPFVEFRRAECLAECARVGGELERARALAREAAEHAADGGYVRFRIMALECLAKAWPPGSEERARARAHAQRLARALADEDLLRRTSPRSSG